MHRSEKSPQAAKATLLQFLKDHPKAALAFSGGCDSAYLLTMAVKAGCDVQPYFAKGAFQPEFEEQDARRLCSQLGVSLKVVPVFPLECEKIRENSVRRCYYCKRLIIGNIMQAAKEDGYTQLWDGTNASDSQADRPGMQALRELQVESPLRLAGLTKDQIRQDSRSLELFTWDKPAYACLATRIPTGTFLTRQDLTRVEKAEEQLLKMGFSNLRVRVRQNAGLLQLPQSQLEKAAELREKIREVLKPWFDTVLLDPVARAEES